MNKYEKIKSSLSDPELLKLRFEKDFPFIYLGDTVKVSPRRAGGSKNSDEGKTGEVINIQHGLQSLFNRDYIGVTAVPESGFENRFGTYLYALDLVKRKPENKELFKNGEIIYLDDRIEVIGNHPKFRATGKVVEVSGYNGKINIVAEDEFVSGEMNMLEEICAKAVENNAKEILSDADLFSGFREKIKKKHPDETFAEEDIMHAYESSIREIIIKEVTSQPDYVSRIDELNKELKFLADISSVKMVERFPPNALFKID